MPIVTFLFQLLSLNLLIILASTTVCFCTHLSVSHSLYNQQRLNYLCYPLPHSQPHLLWFLVNHQFDAQFFSIYLFQFSTCFEQPLAHHQENQLYQYNLWYISLCVGDCFVCKSETCTRNGHLHRVIYNIWCTDRIWFWWWWALGCSKHVGKGNK